MRKGIILFMVIDLFLMVLLAFTVQSQVIEEKPYSSLMDQSFYLKIAAGDSTLFEVTAEGDSALSAIYYSLPYTFLTPEIEVAEVDSLQLTIEFYNGHYSKYRGGEYIFVLVDSLVITSHLQSANLPQSVQVPGGELYRVNVRSNANNAQSQASSIRIRARRHR